MKFEVHSPNLENMQSYLNEQSRNKDYGDGPVWWSLPKGMSSVRILPPWDPTGRVALAVNMHAIEYQGKNMKFKKYNWTCNRATFDKPCKICEALERLQAAGADISKWEPNRRQFYMNAIVMYDPRYQASINAGKKPEDADGVAPGTHVLMRAPKTLYDWVISQITNPMVGDVTSLTNGIDIYITKEGEGLGTKYTPTLSPNGRTPVPQEYLDEIESLYDLDKVFSAGFDDELMNELADHLKKSAGVMANNIPSVVTQMAGYTTPAMTPPVMPAAPAYPQAQTYTQPSPVMPSIPYPPTPNYPATNPVPKTPTNPYTTESVTPGVAPSPFAAAPVSDPGTPPWEAPAGPVYPEPAQQTSSPTEMNLPKCFGNYNPSQVNCVVCPAEIPCSQKSNNR